MEIRDECSYHTNIKILSVFPSAHCALGCLISYAGAPGENGQSGPGRRAKAVKPKLPTPGTGDLLLRRQLIRPVAWSRLPEDLQERRLYDNSTGSLSCSGLRHKKVLLPWA